eukprot:m.17519 g.17519  ORF g.17519 m.17519 type:complete len:398 (-) comp5479_c0_seq1:54-1247(-)
MKLLLSVVVFGTLVVPSCGGDDGGGRMGIEGSALCPPNTHARSNGKGRHVHCICPDHFVCEGCEEGCKIDASPYKDRCIRGFRPDCQDCRCELGPTHSSSLLGTQLLDRRSDDFCGSAVTDSSQRYQGNHTFVFVVSNGHTGTTYLGQASKWRENFGDRALHDFHIAHEQDGDKGLLKSVPWDADFCSKGLAYVLERKLPQMERILNHLDKRVWFGSGHQIILGLLPALADVFGDRARFIRLRRNRLDTAWSFAQKRGGPCTHRCVYCLCPLDPATRCPVRGEAWNSLSVYQKYLWFVDEVECQWQALVGSRPHLKTLEVEWDKKLTPAHMHTIAEFVGMTDIQHQDAAAIDNKANTHPKATSRNDTALAEEDKAYRKAMGFDRTGCSTYHCVGGKK